MNKVWFITGAPNPPLHLPIGEDAPQVLYAYADQVKTDVDAWKDKVTNTSF